MSEYSASPAPAAQPTSSLAIASLLFGILGLTLFPIIGGIIALITGYMARNQIRDSGGTLGGQGLATAGIVLGWICMGLLVVGLCCGGMILIPACAALIGFSTEGGWYYMILPTLLAV
jgi:hypothetical protein